MPIYNESGAIIPSQIITNTQSYHDNYFIERRSLSNETQYSNKNTEDFEIIRSFAEKLLADQLPVDNDIQEVINNHFWEML